MRWLLPGVFCFFAAGAAAADTTTPYAWHLPPGVAPPAVPADNPMSDAKVALGRRLFYDADLSVDGTVSCGTCHEQRRAFTEGNPTHPGVQGTLGRRNVMGLANVAAFDPLTWADPNQHTLEAQVLVPLNGIHPVEMGMAGKSDQLVQRLASDSCYRAMFAAAFPDAQDQIDMVTVAKALAAFERTLLSYDSSYDRFRHGDKVALSDSAKRGLALFTADHCADCHAGVNFTDGKYHHIGLYNLNGAGSYPVTDTGLREVSGRAADEGAFRTPSLRNVALTGPYMHDGKTADLGDAVRRHLAEGAGPNPLREARLQHLTINARGVTDIAAFLQSLSDDGFVSNPAFALPKTACGQNNY